MKKTVIFGITPFSKLIRADMEEDGRPVAAYTVNRAYLPETWEEDIPVVAFEELREFFDDEPFEIILSVGYNKMNENRKTVFRQCDAFGYEIGSFIHSSASCYASSMGRGNVILANCLVSRFVKLGDGNILVNSTVIGHESEIGNFNFFANMTTGGLVTVGDHCFLGMKSVVSNNVSVGDYTLLGAGTVLSKNSDAHTVVMPAKNRTMKLDVEAMGSLLV